MNQREKLEALLTEREPLITSITIYDHSLFKKFGNGYKNSLTYNAQAVNGWNSKGESRNRLGLKYHYESDLATIGYFRRNDTGHFHLIPCQASSERVSELADLLFSISGSPVYIKKVSRDQRDELLRFTNFKEVDQSNGWYQIALLEDDTYPEQILDLGITLEELHKRRKDSQLKDKYIRALRKYIDTRILRIENYDAIKEQQRSDALKVVHGFFGIQEEKRNHLSSPEDYFNIINIKPEGIDCFTSLFYINDEPAGFYFAERIEDIINVYANLALHDKFKYLSELVLIKLFKEALDNGVRKANLGGSETEGLHRFKRKFKPIKENQMYWVLYDKY